MCTCHIQCREASDVTSFFTWAKGIDREDNSFTIVFFSAKAKY